MKSTVLALFLSLGLVACGATDESLDTSRLAADTSGCSPLLQLDGAATTAQGHRLVVTNQRPNSSRCWNIDRSELTIRYYWTQRGDAPVVNQVGFWIRASGADKLLNAYIRCSPAYSSSSSISCLAESTLREYVDRIEIAPVRDGTWDTLGMGMNYTFSL